MCAIQEICLLFIHFLHIPQKWSSYMTSGCCFTLKDSVDTCSVCCYLAISNLFSGCKKFILMNLLKINSRTWTFLFAAASHVRISFAQFGLVHIAKGKSRDVGVCEVCVLRALERISIYNRCVYFRTHTKKTYCAFHLNALFSGTKIEKEDNVGRDQK